MWDFIVKLPKLKNLVIGQLHNVILVIVNRLIKWGYFIACIKEILTENVAKFYVKKVFAQHRSLEKIILNKNPKFMAVFWEIFLAEQRV